MSEINYVKSIIDLLERQRGKGIAKYGQILEDNTTLSRVQRVEHIEEELIDALMYAEHIKAAVEDSLTANDYQRMAMRTASGLDEHSLILNGVMGLNGEAGECIDIMKKHIFQGHELDREHLIEELGDVAWYLAVCCEGLGVSLEEVMEKNIEKLRSRYPEGFDKARSINRQNDAECTECECEDEISTAAPENVHRKTYHAGDEPQIITEEEKLSQELRKLSKAAEENSKKMREAIKKSISQLEEKGVFDNLKNFENL